MIPKVEKVFFTKMNLIIIFNLKNMETMLFKHNSMLFKVQKYFMMKRTCLVKMATFNIMKMIVWKKDFWRLEAVLRNHKVNKCCVLTILHLRNIYIAKSRYILFCIVKNFFNCCFTLYSLFQSMQC
jgi:hypothetical protein